MEGENQPPWQVEGDSSESSPVVAQAAPQTIVPESINNAPEEPQAPPKKSRKKIVLTFLVVLLLFIIVGGSGVFAYGVAYNKIDIGNDNLDAVITNAVISLPFAPKTAEYILGKSRLATADVKSFSFDGSIAGSAGQTLSSVGYGNIDITAKGKFTKNADNKIDADVNVTVSKDADFEIRSKDKKIYVKVNKLPDSIYTLLGLEPGSLDDALKNWISYDTSTVDSEARKLLNEDTKSSGTDDLSSVYNKNKNLLQKFKISTEDNNYKLSLDMSKDEIDSFLASVNEDSYSSSVGMLSVNMWIDKDDYLMRKIQMHIKMSTSKSGASLGILNSDYDLTLAANLYDYNSEVNVEVPANSINYSDFFSQYLNVGVVQPLGQFSQARDTQRRSDLLQITNAVYQYAAEHNGNLPENFPKEETCIGTGSACYDLADSGGAEKIVPTYLASMPKDPQTGTAQDTGYTLYLDSNGRVTVNATSEDGSAISVTR